MPVHTVTRASGAVRIAAYFGVLIAAYLISAWQLNFHTPPVGSGIYRYCVEANHGSKWNCYKTGDVPAGAQIVWSGRESEIPNR